MKILVTGADGQLGTELRGLAKASGMGWDFTDVGELDITDAEATARYVADTTPDILLNAAAYTAVDRAEDDLDRARAINASGPLNLAKAAQTSGIRLVQISTDFVFDGQKSTPYTEDDTPNPLSAYGKTKLEGEKAVLETSGNGVIVRTSWLYSAHGSNFVKTMLRLGREKESLNVVDDQVGSPTWARDLAQALIAILPRLDNTGPEIYHYCNSGTASWYDFADAVMTLAGLTCEVHPIATAEYPTPAPRPAYSKMSTRKIRDRFGLVIPHWRRSLASLLDGDPVQ